jgi:cysteinyl-tRNA synthetase
MDNAKNVIKTFSEFFLNIKVKIRNADDNNNVIKFNDTDFQMLSKFKKLKNEISKELMDCFNTPKVISLLTDFVFEINIYFQKNPKTSLLIQFSTYITKIFKSFGMIDDNIGNFNFYSRIFFK